EYGEVAAGSTCTVSVDIVATMPGTFVNASSVLSGGVFGDGTTPATDTLIIEPAPLFNKAFVASGYAILPGSGQSTPPLPFVIGLNGTSSLVFTIDNTANTLDATNLDFVDNLPADLILASPVNTQTNCTGGTLTANDGGTSISYTGGSVPAGELCVLVVDVTSSVLGTYDNVSNSLTSSHGDSGTASHSLIVSDITVVSKSFARSIDIINRPNTLTFTFDNSVATANNLLSLNDPLPLGMEIASVPNIVTDCAPRVLETADPGGLEISLFDFFIAAGAMCTYSIDIIATASGDLVNITDALGTDLGPSNQATATLTVEQPPAFSKEFVPASIGPGGVSTLTLTIDNSSNTIDATALDFTDNFPAGLTLATPANATSTCSAGTLTAVDGSSVVSYTGGTVLANTTCAINVDVTSSTLGAANNVTGDLTSGHGNSGTATANLLVTNAPLLSKAFSVNPDVINNPNALVFTIDNSMNIITVDNLVFNDPLPAGMIVSATPNASTTCTGGTITAVAGSSTIDFSGGTILASSSCTVSVDVQTTATGGFINTTSVLTSSLGDSNAATAELMISPEPLFEMQFVPNVIQINATSTIFYNMTNQLSTLDVNNFTFTDNLPAGLEVVGTGLSPSKSGGACSATVDAPVGGSTITVTNGVVPASGFCFIAVEVTSSVSGNYENTTGDFISNHGNSGSATANLLVSNTPILSKSFGNNPGVINSPNTLTFTIDNTMNAINVGGLAFDDPLPSGMTVASTPNASSTCVGGTLTAIAESGLISYSGGSVNASSSCTINVDIQVIVPGILTNTTSILSTDLGDSNQAVAELTIIGAPTITKSFVSDSITAGDSIDLTFSVINNSPAAASQISFSDDLQAFISGSQAINLPQNDVCGAGSTVTGSSTIVLQNGALAANSSCQFTVTVSVPNITDAGFYVNNTSVVVANINGISITGSAGAVAQDTLNVSGFAFQIPVLDNWKLMSLLILMMLMMGYYYQRKEQS
ncbi:MAG: beta strand repeat-containing protein, partial [Marinicellaceae bacterium]